MEENELVICLESILDYGDIYLDQSKVDKNYDILCYLRDYKLAPEVGHKLGHFLQVKDERVRFAAAEALTEQQDATYIDLLQPFVFDESSDNIRIRKMVIQTMIGQKWQLKPAPTVQPGPLLENIVITKDYHLSTVPA
ncbi:MAG: HEAT repeat domain-containing protein [Zetaproteobacteria bacterium]|nr:HEAT repeat domain-containing protein [Zetaproteobacteria bacterium]